MRVATNFLAAVCMAILLSASISYVVTDNHVQAQTQATATTAAPSGSQALVAPAANPVASEVVGTTVVTGQPIVDAALRWLMALITLLIPVFGTLLTIWLKAKWNVQIDTNMMSTIQMAALNAAGLLVQRGGAEVAKWDHLDVENPHVKAAIQYFIDAAPDAYKRFGLTPLDVAKKIEAKLGLITPTVDKATGAIATSLPNGLALAAV